jgi:predicted  nucleic acid-binding Zn ribbon protein
MEHSDIYSKLRPPGPTPEDELCRCAGRPPIKLMCALSFDPIHCVNCNLEVPPQTLGLSESLVDEIAHWRTLFDAIDYLWLESGAYENWARDQLSDIASPVNRLGLNLLSALATAHRCYYWYFQDQAAEDFAPIQHCPRCGAPLVPYPAGIFRQSVCEACGIVTVGE